MLLIEFNLKYILLQIDVKLLKLSNLVYYQILLIRYQKSSIYQI